MDRMRHALLALLIAASACAAPNAPRQDKAQRLHECRPGPIRVDSRTTEDVADMCAAAESVASFFRSNGLPRTAPITVSVVDTMPSEMGSNVLGCFARAGGRVTVLSFAAASRRGPWMGRSMDRALYRSLAAHEIAHAMAWCNASGERLSVRAQEYVAYVAMFATMERESREAILAEAPDLSFETAGQISENFYYLAPHKFGIAAYRHYLRPENGPRFLHAVLRAEALPVVDE